MRAARRAGAALLLAATLGVPAAQAQIARLELSMLATGTPTDRQFLTHAADTPLAFVAAELRLPRGGAERLPAVVLLHGSGGAGALEDQWARELAAQGVATLIVDSFTGRGVQTTFADQDRLSRLVQVLDAYRALERLAQHPRIDPARIFVMGFSRGGGAAHWAALERFATQLAGPAGPRFAGHLALYPTCNRAFRDATRLTAPVRIFHGSADDYVPPAECRDYVERLRAAGNDITFTEYAGAGHVFDNPVLQPPLRLSSAQSTRHCPPIVETAAGDLVDADSRQPFRYASDPCVELGATVAYDPAAHAAVQAAVRAFVASTRRAAPAAVR